MSDMTSAQNQQNDKLPDAPVNLPILLKCTAAVGELDRDIKGAWLYVDRAGGGSFALGDNSGGQGADIVPSSLIGFRADFSRIVLKGEIDVWAFPDSRNVPSSGGLTTILSQIVAGQGAAGAPVGGVLSVQQDDIVGAQGNLNALNATAQVVSDGRLFAQVTFTGPALVGTLTAEYSLDGGVNWDTGFFWSNGAFNTTFLNPSNSVGAWATIVGRLPGATHFRVRVSAYTSGSILATLRATGAGPNIAYVVAEKQGGSGPQTLATSTLDGGLFVDALGIDNSGASQRLGLDKGGNSGWGRTKTVERYADWAIDSTPGLAAQATVTRGAVGSTFHMATGITATLTTTAATSNTILCRLRDGASGVGAIIWETQLTTPATVGAGDRISKDFSKALIGTAGNAMCLEFAAAGAAGSQEIVSLSGYDAVAGDL